MEFSQLFPEVNDIGDDSLRQQVEEVWRCAMERGGWQEDDLRRIPFTLLIPDTAVNLVQHTRVVTGCARGIAERLMESYDDVKINMDYLIAGGLLHDVGKLLEYERTREGYQKSRNGALLRHPVSGANLASEFGLPAEIVHIIYTHSKEGNIYDRSIESIIVHHSDFVNFEPLRAIAHG